MILSVVNTSNICHLKMLKLYLTTKEVQVITSYCVHTDPVFEVLLRTETGVPVENPHVVVYTDHIP